METLGPQHDLLMLPHGLSIEKIPEDRRPTSKDWEQVQGGKPTVKRVGPRQYDVIHNYENPDDPSGTGVVVPTSLHTLENWSTKIVTVIIDKKEVEFPVALLWKYHGRPCEGRSRGSYERIQI